MRRTGSQQITDKQMGYKQKNDGQVVVVVVMGANATLDFGYSLHTRLIGRSQSHTSPRDHHIHSPRQHRNMLQDSLFLAAISCHLLVMTRLAVTPILRRPMRLQPPEPYSPNPCCIAIVDRVCVLRWALDRHQILLNLFLARV